MSKILIIDDAEAARKEVAKVVNEIGHEPLFANDGKDGLAMLKIHQDVALIVLDINMPELNGIEFLKIAQLNDKIPVIVISTESDADTVAILKNLKIRGYCTKPFNHDAMKKVMVRLLQK